MREYYSSDNPRKIKRFSKLMKKNMHNDKQIVFVCIGSTKSFCDSIAPRIGSEISKLEQGYKVYGTYENPVNALNIADTIDRIYKESENPFVIAIDASIGKNLGKLFVQDEPICPGAGIPNRELPQIGDISIACVIAKTYEDMLNHDFMVRMEKDTNNITRQVKRFVSYISNGIKLIPNM